tara:strand:+ start:86 stop:334 length:249 start_codon:yes stop_codon:yes gene_type:complete
MKTFKVFGPTLGRGKLSRKFINAVNFEVEKSITNRKNDYSSKLASQIKNEIRLSNSFIKKKLIKRINKEYKKLPESIRNFKN